MLALEVANGDYLFSASDKGILIVRRGTDRDKVERVVGRGIPIFTMGGAIGDKLVDVYYPAIGIAVCFASKGEGYKATRVCIPAFFAKKLPKTPETPKPPENRPKTSKPSIPEGSSASIATLGSPPKLPTETPRGVTGSGVAWIIWEKH
jgi:hypothetical protein